MTTDQPRADAIAALRGYPGAGIAWTFHPQGAYVRWADIAALAPADPQHEHYGETCPACAADAAPADPTADLRAAVERWLTSQEYDRMEAEGAVAAMLGYEWSEAGQGGWVLAASTTEDGS